MPLAPDLLKDVDALLAGIGATPQNPPQLTSNPPQELQRNPQNTATKPAAPVAKPRRTQPPPAPDILADIDGLLAGVDAPQAAPAPVAPRVEPAVQPEEPILAEAVPEGPQPMQQWTGQSLEADYGVAPTGERLPGTPAPDPRVTPEYWQNLDKDAHVLPPDTLDEAIAHRQAGKGYRARQATTEYWQKRVPLYGEAVAAFEYFEFSAAIDRLGENKGNYSGRRNDLQLLAHHLVRGENESKRGQLRRVADIVTALPGFAGPFMLSLGGYAAGKELTKKGIQKLLSRGMKKQLAKTALRRGLTRGAAGLAARVPAVATQTALNPQLVVREASRRMATEFHLSRDEAGELQVIIDDEGDGFAEALLKGYADAFIEIGSEHLGGAFDHIPAPARLRLFKMAVIRRWLQKPGRTLGDLKTTLKKLGYHGPLSEVIEERAGEVARGATGLEEHYGVTGGLLGGEMGFGPAIKQLIDEVLAFTVPAAPGMIGRTYEALKLPGKIGFGTTKERTAQLHAQATRRILGTEEVEGEKNDVQKAIEELLDLDNINPTRKQLRRAGVKVPSPGTPEQCILATRGLREHFAGLQEDVAERKAAGEQWSIPPRTEKPSRREFAERKAGLKTREEMEMEERYVAEEEAKLKTQEEMEAEDAITNLKAETLDADVLKRERAALGEEEGREVPAPERGPRVRPGRPKAEAEAVPEPVVEAREAWGTTLEEFKQSISPSEIQTRKFGGETRYALPGGMGIKGWSSTPEKAIEHTHADIVADALRRDDPVPETVSPLFDGWNMPLAEYLKEHPQYANADTLAVSETDTRRSHKHIIRRALILGRLSAGEYNDLHAREYGPIEKFVPDLAPTTPEPAVKEKQPWQMTKAEAADQLIPEGQPIETPQFWADKHKADVKAAIAAGKPVPAEVLADYPDLAAKKPKEPRKKAEKRLDTKAVEAVAEEPVAKRKPAKTKAEREFRENVQQTAKGLVLTPEETGQLEAHVLERHKTATEHAGRREEAKQAARQATGLTAADIRRLENTGHDFASKPERVGGRTGQKLKSLDKMAQSLASDFPDVIHRDTAASDVWDLIKEGKQTPTIYPSESAIAEVARAVAEVAPPPKKPTKPPSAPAAMYAAVPAGAGAYGSVLQHTKLPHSTPAKTPVPLAETVADVDEKKLGGVLDSVWRLVSPTSRGEMARLGARTIRKAFAATAQVRAAVKHEPVLRKARRAFSRTGRDEILDFYDNMELGRSQENAKLNRVAAKLRHLLDKLRGEVQNLGTGKLQTFNENYFPHIWSNPKKARNILGRLLGRRPLEGSKGFLKRRTIPTIREGVELGLVPVSWNPVDLMFLKATEMLKYIEAEHILQELKQAGAAQFVYIKGQAPQGYVKIEDPKFTVYGPPAVSVKEAYDAILVESLMDLARSIGINPQRVMKLGQKFGTSAETGEVKTRFGAPESVLIHEIGHQLGFKYNLFDWMLQKTAGKWVPRKNGEMKFAPDPKAVARRKIINKEWQALADLRFEGREPIPAFRKYVRRKAEKEAVLLEAFIHAPDRMKQTAPTLYEDFYKFLNDRAELRPLLDIKPSLVLEAREEQVDVPGMITMGHWAVPGEIATLINNHLGTGLWNSEYDIVAKAYEIGRQSGNILNQAQLAWSAFHGLFTTISVMASQSGQALRNLVSTDPAMIKRGLVQVVTMPVATPLNLWRGGQGIRAWRTDLDQIRNPELRKFVEAMIVGGARGEMDKFYFNQASDHLQVTIEELLNEALGGKIKASLKLPLNSAQWVIEKSMYPVLQWLVPRQKVGMFMMLARDEMARLKTKDLSDPVLAQRLTEAWDSVENRLGQLTYDNLFWNRTLKDTLMGVTRAVGWNLGFIREYAVGGPLDILTTKQRMERGDAAISLRTAELAGTVFFLGILGATMQYLMIGEPPEELKDYFFPKTGRLRPDGSPERLSLPTYAKDLWGWGTGPLRTASHKAHPIIGLVSDTLRNEDFYGTEIRHPDDPVVKQFQDVATYVGRAFMSFSMRNWEQYRKDGASKMTAAAVAITGIGVAPAYVSKSPAQRLMTEHIVSNLPQGTRTKEQFSRSDLRRTMIHRLRQNKPLDNLNWQEHFTQRDLSNIKKEAVLPPFGASFKRLQLDQALDVYAIATDKERNEAANAMLKKFLGASDKWHMENRWQDVQRFFDPLWIDIKRRVSDPAMFNEATKLAMIGTGYPHKTKTESVETYKGRVRDHLRKQGHMDEWLKKRADSEIVQQAMLEVEASKPFYDLTRSVHPKFTNLKEAIEALKESPDTSRDKIKSTFAVHWMRWLRGQEWYKQRKLSK